MVSQNLIIKIKMEQKQVPDLYYKYLIVGDSGVGKTALLQKYTSAEIHQEHRNQGVDSMYKSIYCADFRAWLDIWDTAGQQKFHSITKSSYKGKQGILLVYSITDPISFKNIDDWIAEIKNVCSEETKIVLLGCKCDQQNQRKVSKQEGEQMGLKHNIRFFQVSSITNRNVYLTFFTLTKQIFEEQQRKAEQQLRKAQQKQNKKQQEQQDEDEDQY